jgi:hypothetical protein
MRAGLLSLDVLGQLSNAGATTLRLGAFGVMVFGLHLSSDGATRGVSESDK